MTGVMRFMAPRPLDDRAWRVGDGMPGVAHFFGWRTHRGTLSHCWAERSIEGTRQACEDDPLCPDCEAWFWEHEAAVTAGAGRELPIAQVPRTARPPGGPGEGQRRSPNSPRRSLGA
jgi:hypothetical protein